MRFKNIVCMHYGEHFESILPIFVFLGADILVVFIIFFDKKCWNYENNGCFL
jgi:hypothetical protein